MERRAFLAATGTVVTAPLAGCMDGEQTGGDATGEETTTRATPTNAVTITFAVPPVGSNRPIPERYTCVGENVSPEVEIVEVGDEADSLALALVDPDADDTLHWSVWGISPLLPRLPESVPREPEVRLTEVEAVGDDVDRTVVQGRNFRDEVGYYGPCPPAGERHRYLFTLYGLDRPLDLEPGAPPAVFRDALDGHVVGRTAIGTFFER